MNALIKPAVHFAGRLQFSHKFLLVFAIFTLPMAVALWSIIDDSLAVLHKAERSQAGQQLILALKPIAITMAKHRGNSSQYLNGASGKEETIEQLENQLQQLFSTYQHKLHAIDLFVTSDLAINDIRQQWQLLLLSTATTDVDANFAAHTRVIEDVLKLIYKIATQSELILETDLSLYYLSNMVSFSISELQEILGQLRGKAASAVTDAQISEKERLAVHTQLVMKASVLANFEHSLDIASEYPNIKSALSSHGKSFQKDLTSFTDLVQSQIIDSSYPAVHSDEIFDSGTQAISQLEEMNNAAALLLTRLRDRHIANDNTEIKGIIALALIALAFSLYLVLGITTSMRGSMNVIKQTSEQLSGGNFNIRYNIKTRDVLSEVAASLNKMIRSINGLISNIQASTYAVDIISKHLLKCSSISEDAVQKQHQQTTMVATAATEMATTVKEIANHCAQANEATQNAQNAATNSEKVVSDAIVSINDLAGDVESASETIAALEQEVEQIGSVIDVIRSIAEQTNLLALNAAIEAARAGEQGRGFAVVADEVRSLAGRTQQSTTEIQAMIEKLQDGSKQAVEATEAGKSRAGNVVNTITQAGQALSNIQTEINQLVDLNLHIAAACKQQIVVAQEISENANGMDAAGEAILSQVKQTAASSDQLLESSNALAQSAKKFSIH